MSKRKTAGLVTAGAIGAYAGWRALRRKQLERRNAAVRRGQSIVILGAGFAGLNAARRLAQLLPGPDDARITLIDQRNYLLFTPMLPEVAGGELDPLDVVRPPRLVSRRIDFLQAAVDDVDLARKRVTVRVAGEVRTIAADYLLIALGSLTNFHGLPGVEERALTMKSLEDAQLLRNRANEMLEQAEAGAGDEKRRTLLTFVVAGGGFTGVETAAALDGFVREAARQYPSIRQEEIETYVIEPGERLLKELDADLAAYAREKLEQGGVRVIVGAKLASANDDFVELAGGRRIPTRTLVWAAGVKPSPVVEKIDCRRGRHGGIVVDRRCQIEGHERAWAAGDCAEVPEPEGHGTYAPTAQNATREGECIAENIVRVMRGEAQEPFRHRTIGEMALVGRRAGVGRIYGVHFSGVSAWVLWRLVYLSKMPGWRERARILFDWMLDFAFGRPTAAIPPHSADIRSERPQPAGSR